MDQAFRSTHGVGLVDYQKNPELRLQVEMQREQDYQVGQIVAAQMERQAHRDA